MAGWTIVHQSQREGEQGSVCDVTGGVPPQSYTSARMSIRRGRAWCQPPQACRHTGSSIAKDVRDYLVSVLRLTSRATEQKWDVAGCPKVSCFDCGQIVHGVKGLLVWPLAVDDPTLQADIFHGSCASPQRHKAYATISVALVLCCPYSSNSQTISDLLSRAEEN